MNILKKILLYFKLIRFSHTIFAMPFALLGTAIAYIHTPQNFTGIKFLYIIMCMIFARTSAMAFNRYLDRDIDALNPRTQSREIPSGKISAWNALVLTIISAVLFSFFSFLLNKLCFYLSPIALLIILGYSYTKRFTWFCHIILGLGLALAPIGAYIAITGTIHGSIILIAAAVLMWVSGFDVIYALQDEDFDKAHHLFSIPVFLGRKNAMMLSRLFHLTASLLLLINFYIYPFGNIYLLGWVIFSLLLVYEHYLITPEDISKIPFAFGHLNSWAGLIFGALSIADVLFKHLCFK